MKSTTSRVTALLALAGLFALMADTSEAGWRRRGSSGSSGSYGSSGSSGSWGSSGSGGHHGRRHHHHYSYSCSSSGGSSGSYGWSSSHGSSGSSGYHSTHSYGSHGSSGSHGYVTSPSHHYSTYAAQSKTVIARSTPTRTLAPSLPAPVVVQSDNRARIRLNVPADAVVYLVGQKMSLTGQQRTYRLPELPAGKTYQYPIKVEVVRDGRTLEVEHSESVIAGQTTTVAIVEEADRLIVKSDEADQFVADAR